MNAYISTHKNTQTPAIFTPIPPPNARQCRPQCSLAPTQCAVKAGLAHSKTRFFLLVNHYSEPKSGPLCSQISVKKYPKRNPTRDATANRTFKRHTSSKEELGRGGLEPPTHGFSVRCSTN